MFGKAKVKRFNEEGSCAPAPNAYDTKLAQSKSGIPILKSQRFDDPKYITPGPGQYQVPGGLGASKHLNISVQSKLFRSSSFRIKKTSFADLTCDSTKSAGIFSTPYSSTPRKIRRSLSSSNLSSPKPSENQELERLKEENYEKEKEIKELKLRLSAQEDSVVVRYENENTILQQLRDQLEMVQAELETCREELRYKTELCEEIGEEKEKLLFRCELLEEKGDRVECLTNEVELLTQDNSTLEEEIASLRHQRKQAEKVLEEIKTKRSQLEAKCEDENAKNIFLHFTQEQLNSQMNSLESIVNSLKQENHLLSRGLKKMIAALQEEKTKNTEITDAYTRENADSEEEFNRLQEQLVQERQENEKSVQEFKSLEVELRAQLGAAFAVTEEIQEKLASSDSVLLRTLQEKEEVEAARERIQEELMEAARELEVSENDKTVLKDALKAGEDERTGLALDLGQLAKSKMDLDERLREAVSNHEQRQHQLDDVRGEVHELEMTRVGLEGMLASLREEVGQLETGLCEKTDLLDSAYKKIQLLESRCEDQDELIEEKRALIAKLEEMNSFLIEKDATLNSTLQTQVDELKALVEEGCKDNACLIENSVTLEDQLRTSGQKAEEAEKHLEEMTLCLETEQQNHQELKQKSNNLEQELNEKANKMKDDSNLIHSLKKEMEEVSQEKTHLEKMLSDRENDISDLTTKVEELKLSREEIEESLLDTQELVSCMETKLEEAFNQHRDEADGLCSELRRVEEALAEVRVERAKLIDINTDLSSQVSESLHALANLQERERVLGNKCHEYQIQLEMLEEDADQDRLRLQQAEDEISNLQAELEASLTEIGEMEAARIQDGEEHSGVVEQLEHTRTAYAQLLQELQEAKTVGRELYGRLQELEAEQDKQEKELNTWKQRSYDGRAEVKLLSEQVSHLEGLRNNLELNVAEKIDLLLSLRDEMTLIRELSAKDKVKLEDTHKSNLRLKGNLEVRLEEVRALRQEQEVHQKEIQTLRQKQDMRREEARSQRQEQEVRQQDLACLRQELNQQEKQLKDREEEVARRMEEKEERIRSLETDRAEKDKIRMREMEMLIELRAVVDQQKEDMELLQEMAEQGESAQRSMEAQQRVLCDAENRVAEAEDALRKWRVRMEEAEFIMKEMEARLEAKELEYNQLQEMIEPFREQLESFEIEKNSLLSQSEQAQDEVKKLSMEYGKLLGHQNQKQKIQHVVKIKHENVELKADILSLKEQLAKSKKSASRLEDRLNELTGSRRFDSRLSFQTPGPAASRNKENSCPTPRDSMMTPVAGFRDRSMSTPMGPPVKDVEKTRASRSLVVLRR